MWFLNRQKGCMRHNRIGNKAFQGEFNVYSINDKKQSQRICDSV